MDTLEEHLQYLPFYVLYALCIAGALFFVVGCILNLIARPCKTKKP